jgi:hypothetical protein
MKCKIKKIMRELPETNIPNNRISKSKIYKNFYEIALTVDDQV